VDDHPLIRLGIRTILEDEPGFVISGEASTGIEAVDFVKREKPNLAVIDLTMPEMDGIEATMQIRKLSPSTDVLILTMHFSDDIARDVMRSGARGYLLKSDADAELILAVHRIRNRGTFYTAQLSESMANNFLNAVSGEGVLPGTPLTPREVEIVQLLAEGKSNKEVAGLLGVSTRTVESHRNHIMSKMKFTSFSDLVRFAIRVRLVQL
jgi:DNA-binding NarL/FixJ family response regulator